MNRLLISALLLIASLTPAATAQSKLEFVSKNAVHGQVPMQCRVAEQELITQLNRFPHPNDWPYVIVCDDRSWNQLMQASLNGSGKYIFGSTLHPERTTLFRATTLLGMDKVVTPEHVTAHELAHVYLNSSDEVAVDKLALKWIADRQPQELATE